MSGAFRKLASSILIFYFVIYFTYANGMQRMAGGRMHIRKAACDLPSTLRLRGGVEGPEPPVFEEKEEAAEEDLARIQANVLKMWDVGMQEQDRLKRDGGLDLKENRGKVSEISEQESERILREEQEERKRAAKRAAEAASEAEKQGVPAPVEKAEELKAEEHTLGSQETKLSAADFVADNNQPPALPGSQTAAAEQATIDSKPEEEAKPEAPPKEEVQDDVNLDDLRKQLAEVHVFFSRA